MAKAELLYPDGYAGNEEYSTMKGWLSVDVRLPSGAIVPIMFYDPARFANDVANALAAGNSCFAEAGVVIIESVTPANMERALKTLIKDNFFAALTPSS